MVAKKRTEVLTHTIARLKLQKTITDRSQTCVKCPPFICSVQNGQICTDLEYSSRYQKLQILGIHKD